MDHAELTAKVDSMVTELTADLKRLAAIPSIACPGYPTERVTEAHDLFVEPLRDAGVQDLAELGNAASPRPGSSGSTPPRPGRAHLSAAASDTRGSPDP